MNGRIIMKNSELIDLLSKELVRKTQDDDLSFASYEDYISDCVKNWIIDNKITMSNNESPVCKICGFQISEEESKRNDGICYDCNLDEDL